MVGALLILLCGSLVGVVTYLLQKKSRTQAKQVVLCNFLNNLSRLQTELTKGEKDFKNLIESIYSEFLKISTQHKDLCVLQRDYQGESDDKIQQVDRLITELIDHNTSTVNIIELLQKPEDDLYHSDNNFQQMLVKELKSDMSKKKIQLEEVYLLQILILIVNTFPVDSCIQYVCFKAYSFLTPAFMHYLRQIITQKLSEQSDEVILTIYEKLFKTDDSKADDQTLIQIYSLPNISLENKKTFVKTHIFGLQKESSSTLLMSVLGQYNLTENNSGDFMIRLKRLIGVHAKKG